MGTSRSQDRSIGGDDTPLRYLFLFLVGVVVGCGVRLALVLVPDSLVEALRERVLPGQAE